MWSEVQFFKGFDEKGSQMSNRIPGLLWGLISSGPHSLSMEISLLTHWHIRARLQFVCEFLTKQGTVPTEKHWWEGNAVAGTGILGWNWCGRLGEHTVHPICLSVCLHFVLMWKYLMSFYCRPCWYMHPDWQCTVIVVSTLPPIALLPKQLFLSDYIMSHDCIP